MTLPAPLSSPASVRPARSLNARIAATAIQAAPAVDVLLPVLVVSLGHWIVNLPAPFVVSFAFTPELNRAWRFDLPNLDAAMFGFALLTFGAFRFARVIRGRWGPPPPGSAAEPPAACAVSDSNAHTLRVALLLLAAGAACFALLVSRVTTLRFSALDIALWLSAMALGAGACWWVDRAAGQRLAVSVGKREAAALAVLLVAAFLLGIYRLEWVPSHLVGDEGIFWEQAKGIAEGRSRQSFFQLGAYSFPIASGYFQALFPLTFGQSVWSWRLSSYVAAWLALPPTYFLARHLFSRRVAFAALAIAAFLPYFLAFSRIGYNSSQSLAPTAAAFLCLAAGTARRSVFWTFLAGCVAGIGYLTFPATRTVGPAAVLFFAYLALARRASVRTVMGMAALFFAGLLLAAVPHLVAGATQNPAAMSHKMLEACFCNAFYGRAMFPEAELYKYFPPIKVGDQTIFYNPEIWGKLLVKGVFRTALGFSHDRLFTEHMMTSALAGPVSGVFFTLGIATAIARVRQARFALLLSWFVVSFFALSALNTFPPRHTHFLSTIPALAIFSAVGMWATMEAARLLRGWWSHAGVGLIVFAAGAAGVYHFFVLAPRHYRPELEDVIFWEALDLDRPETFIYVFREAREQSLVPYGLRWFTTPAQYTTYSVYSMASPGQLLIDRTKPTRIFFRSELAAQVLPAVERHFGRPGETFVYTRREGTPHVTVVRFEGLR